MLGRFHQHIFAAFLRKQDVKLFLANGVQRINGQLIWQISPHISGKFQWSSLRQSVGEIKWQIFCLMMCAGNFLLGAQGLVKSTQEHF
jgi:hypothetical protein